MSLGIDAEFLQCELGSSGLDVPHLMDYSALFYPIMKEGTRVAFLV
jgi:hypothetical protein